ncbi:Hypothetical predicted protein [Octopus vulgaris]|uniref:Uncharacterized protein n=1 Tax=Octopus vulgaris TaxID=6645 RepID=A0AA36B878_OCTVU|nr:Hypothetical predicted protein [Octopus vulgaris]
MFHLPPSSCAVLTVEVLQHLEILVFVLNLPSRCHTVKTFHHCQGRSIHLEWKTQHFEVTEILHCHCCQYKCSKSEIGQSRDPLAFCERSIQVLYISVVYNKCV